MSSRSWRRWRGLPALVVGLVGLLPAVAGAATLSATPASFGSVFAGAQAGDTVVLAPGAYGTFYGAQKAGMVTVRAAAGATASLKVWFRPASNITLDGVTITDLEIGDAATKNIVVRDSSFDRAQAVVRTGELVNANVVFDHDSFTNFDKCSDCSEGRVQLAGKSSKPSGVTIENSLFSGGNSDGVQDGGNGARIVGNEFAGIHQVDGASGVHADSIQLYGSANTVVRGNYFHDVATGIMAADGADHELIEDNVFAVSGSPFAVDLESDNGSVFRHNTLLDHGSCDYGQRCGTLYVGNKSGDPASRGTVVSDNILTSICVCEGATGGFGQEGYNLFTNAPGSGGPHPRGPPTFLGGALPGTLAGFALAPGSLGKNNASDGTDRGATINGAIPTPTPTPTPTPSPPPTPTPTPSPTPTPTPTPTPSPSPTPDTPAMAIWTAPSGVVAGVPTVLDGSRSTGNGPIACTWSFENADGSTVWDTATGCKLQKTFTSVGTKYVRLTVRDADGDTNSSKQSF